MGLMQGILHRPKTKLALCYIVLWALGIISFTGQAWLNRIPDQNNNINRFKNPIAVSTGKKKFGSPILCLHVNICRAQIVLSTKLES